MTADDVVLLHGIWMPALEMQFVRRRLERDHGYRGHLFGYPSVRGRLDENALALRAYVGRVAADAGAGRVHLVGHSLGGVVALRMLARWDDAPVGRVVCLGSPLAGSRAGRGLDARRPGRAIVGRSLKEGVIESPAEAWAGDALARHETGVIAGTRPVGLGRLFASFDEPSDGTVAVAETRIPGLRDHVCLPVSHTGMALSREVAEQTAAFLRRGTFLREPQRPG